MKHTSTLLYGFPIELTSCCLRSHSKVHTYLYQLEGESNENLKVLELFKDHRGPSHLILPSPQINLQGRGAQDTDTNIIFLHYYSVNRLLLQCVIKSQPPPVMSMAAHF